MGLSFSRRTYRRPTSAIITLVLFIVGTAAVGAFQLTPMKIVLDAQGSGRTTSLSVQNTNPEPIAVQITVMSREVFPDGSERNDPITGTFRVYPSQIIVQPGQTQIVRVQYMGPSDIAVEQAFRLEARQLPINITDRDAEESTGVKIVLRYLATLYVAPPDAEPNLNVYLRDYDVTTGTGELVIENHGTGHADLVGATIEASGVGGAQSLALADFNKDYSASLPAGFARVIPLEGELRFEPQELEVVTD